MASFAVLRGGFGGNGGNNNRQVLNGGSSGGGRGAPAASQQPRLFQNRGMGHSNGINAGGGQVLLQRSRTQQPIMKRQRQQQQQQQQTSAMAAAKQLVAPRRQQKQQRAQSRQEGEEITGICMEEVMRDIAILEQEQRKSQLALEDAQRSRQAMTLQKSDMEAHLGKLKFQNGESGTTLTVMIDAVKHAKQSYDSIHGIVNGDGSNLNNLNAYVMKVRETSANVANKNSQITRMFLRLQRKAKALESQAQAILENRDQACQRLEETTSFRNSLCDDLEQERAKQKKVTEEVATVKGEIKSCDLTLSEKKPQAVELDNKTKALEESKKNLDKTHKEKIEDLDKESAETAKRIDDLKSKISRAENQQKHKGVELNDVGMKLLDESKRHDVQGEDGQYNEAKASSKLESAKKTVEKEKASLEAVRREVAELEDGIKDLKDKERKVQMKLDALKESNKTTRDDQEKKRKTDEGVVEEFKKLREELNNLDKQVEEHDQEKKRVDDQDKEREKELAAEMAKIESESRQFPDLDEEIVEAEKDKAKKEANHLKKIETETRLVEEELNAIQNEIAKEERLLEEEESEFSNQQIEDEIRDICQTNDVLESLIHRYQPNLTPDEQANESLQIIFSDIEKRIESAKKARRVHDEQVERARQEAERIERAELEQKKIRQQLREAREEKERTEREELEKQRLLQEREALEEAERMQREQQRLREAKREEAKRIQREREQQTRREERERQEAEERGKQQLHDEEESKIKEVEEREEQKRREEQAVQDEERAQDKVESNRLGPENLPQKLTIQEDLREQEQSEHAADRASPDKEEKAAFHNNQDTEYPGSGLHQQKVKAESRKSLSETKPRNLMEKFDTADQEGAITPSHQGETAPEVMSKKKVHWRSEYSKGSPASKSTASKHSARRLSLSFRDPSLEPRRSPHSFDSDSPDSVDTRESSGADLSFLLRKTKPQKSTESKIDAPMDSESLTDKPRYINHLGVNQPSSKHSANTADITVASDNERRAVDKNWRDDRKDRDKISRRKSFNDADKAKHGKRRSHVKGQISAPSIEEDENHDVDARPAKSAKPRNRKTFGSNAGTRGQQKGIAVLAKASNKRRDDRSIPRMEDEQSWAMNDASNQLHRRTEDEHAVALDDASSQPRTKPRKAEANEKPRKDQTNGKDKSNALRVAKDSSSRSRSKPRKDKADEKDGSFALSTHTHKDSSRSSSKPRKEKIDEQEKSGALRAHKDSIHPRSKPGRDKPDRVKRDPKPSSHQVRAKPQKGTSDVHATRDPKSSSHTVRAKPQKGTSDVHATREPKTSSHNVRGKRKDTNDVHATRDPKSSSHRDRGKRKDTNDVHATREPKTSSHRDRGNKTDQKDKSTSQDAARGATGPGKRRRVAGESFENKAERAATTKKSSTATLPAGSKKVSSGSGSPSSKQTATEKRGIDPQKKSAKRGTDPQKKSASAAPVATKSRKRSRQGTSTTSNDGQSKQRRRKKNGASKQSGRMENFAGDDVEYGFHV